MGLLGFVVLGLVAGSIAQMLVPGRSEPNGCISTTAVGMLGAVVGGWVATQLDLGRLRDFYDLETWLVAIGGSVLLITVFRAISR